MKKISDWSVGTKLAVSFAGVVGLLLIVGAVSIRATKTLEQDLEEMQRQGVESNMHTGTFATTMMTVRKDFYRGLLSKDGEELKKISTEIDGNIEAAKDLLDKAETSLVHEHDKQELGKLREDWKAYIRLTEGIRSNFAKGDLEAARPFFPPAAKFYVENVAPKIEELIKATQEDSLTLYQEARAQAGSTFRTLILLIAVAVLAASAVAVVLTRNIRRSLDAVVAAMASLSGRDIPSLCDTLESMSNGDFTKEAATYTEPIDVKTQDEFGALSKSLNEVIGLVGQAGKAVAQAEHSLSGLIHQVAGQAVVLAESSVQLSEASAQTAGASNQISMTMDQVARAVTETSQTSTEIARGSEKLANDATEATKAAQNLLDDIEHVKRASDQQREGAERSAADARGGSKTLQLIIEAMEKIREQVQTTTEAVLDLGAKQEQIGEIVKTIDEIAAQTNLLALNAAIEAARAGEHGRGFAVVADEVRKLAERSGQATQEIASLIEMVRQGVGRATEEMKASAHLAEEGNSHSGAAQAVLEGILESAEESQKLADESYKLVQSMAKAAESVSESISSVAAVSQQTAAGAQQMSATSEEMAASAQEVTATIEEQTASTEEVSATAQSLSAIADDVKKLLAGFKTRQLVLESNETRQRRAA